MAKKRRDGNPANKHNWKLVCTHCGAEFLDIETVDLADGHYQQEHPGESIAFTTVWQGVGPTPKGGPRYQEAAGTDHAADRRRGHRQAVGVVPLMVWICEECKNLWETLEEFPNQCRHCGNSTRIEFNIGDAVVKSGYQKFEFPPISVTSMELPPPPIRFWRIETEHDDDGTRLFVTDGVKIGEGLWYANSRKQSVWVRLKNFIARKGSTAKVVHFTNDDLNKVGRYLAEKYGLEWNDVRS